MKMFPRLALATLTCLCFSLVLAGSASAQNDNANVTVNGFTQLELRNDDFPDFSVGASEFDTGDLSDGTTEDFGTVDATDEDGERDVSVRGLSNKGGYNIGVKVTSPLGDAEEVESVTLNVIEGFGGSTSGNNTEVSNSKPTLESARTTTDLVKRVKKGRLQFGVSYSEVVLNGDNVSPGEVTVDITYTISNIN